MEPIQISEWFLLRWQPVVTYLEVRPHLAVETQRQWSYRTIARTTPILMGLFPWVALAAHSLPQRQPMTHRTAACYARTASTFIDPVALVRRRLWLASGTFQLSQTRCPGWLRYFASFHNYTLGHMKICACFTLVIQVIR